MTDIPDEAVEAAARARFDSAHYVDAWPSLPARERQRWLEQTRPWVTAAVPLIAAQATADLHARIEALRDELASAEPDVDQSARVVSRHVRDCLDALLRGAANV